MPILSVDGAVTGYGKLPVLHGVSIEAATVAITAVFWPNGSGKSTLVKAIAGLLPLWQGTVRLGERDLTRLAAHQVVREGVSLMPQGGGVFPQLTVLENLRLGGHVVGSNRVVQERIDRLLDEYPSLARRRSVAAGNLSGGEQMMLAIARALVAQPRFLLLDEPSAGLAPKLVAETLERVAELRARSVGVLMVEQNIREALRVADRCYILVGGANRWQGTPADIEDDRLLLVLYLGAA